MPWLLAQMVKNPQETWIWSLSQEEALKKRMATHSSILAWRIPWTEKPGRVQSMGLQRVGHDWVTNHTHTWTIYYHHSERIGASLVAQIIKNLPAMQETPVQSLDLENPLEKGMATQNTVVGCRSLLQGIPGRLQSWSCKELDVTEN